MKQFPIELLTQIFGFIHPIYDRLARFSLVCHRWKEIIQKTSSLWEHIHLKPVQLTEKEKNIVFRCLREYNEFIKCLRVASLDLVFGTDFWFFVHRVTLEMTNLTCLDIPTFPWNLEQFVTFRSAENLKELNLYGFWDLSNFQWTQTFSQPVSLINQGHLQLIKVKCPQLQVLKLSINMLRLPEKALVEFLDAVNLKELQISAYNSCEANIPMNGNSLRLLRCLLSSRYVSKITKLDLRYISIGHKELRLLLKLLESLRYLKLCFLDIHRCMTGYQYLDSKSLEHLTLNDLPAKNIVRLKCSMPKLRSLIISGCANLKSLQVLSSLLEKLFLNFLANLQSLHVTSMTLRHFEVANCQSLTSKTIEKVLQYNRRIEHCTIRGHLVNFHCSQMEASGVLTELCLWITDFYKLEHVQVHCPTLKSFMCNHLNLSEEFTILTPEPSIDVRCNVLLDFYISLPRINSIDIKCKTIKHLMLNLGQHKSDMPCNIVRVSAEKGLMTFCASNCTFTRVEIFAEEINNLDFSKCSINGEIKFESNCIDMICMRNVTQENIDLIARCDEIRRVFLRGCDTLCTVNVFLDEKQLYYHNSHTHEQNLQMPLSDYVPEKVIQAKEDVTDFNITNSRERVDSKVKKVVKTVATLNCPCFHGLLIYYENKSRNKEKPSKHQDLSFCNEQHPGTSAENQEDDLVLHGEGTLEVSENLNPLRGNSGSSSVLHGSEHCIGEKTEYPSNQEVLKGNHQENCKQKANTAACESVNRCVSLTNQVCEDNNEDTFRGRSTVSAGEQGTDD